MEDIQLGEFELLEELSDVAIPEKRREILRKYTEKMETQIKFLVSDFEEGLQWLNTSSALSMERELQGKVVVLDFFTYCCVNCLHILPDLEHLEDRFSIQDGVIVLGVHSAKFANEKVLSNILSAVLRYNIEHPVVNDHEASLWHKLQISCWPTLVVVSPSGHYLRTFVGEGHRESLMEYVSVVMEYFKERDMIKTHTIPISLEKDRLPATPLKFPGKVTVTKNGKLVAISDSGHNRVIVCGKDGIVKFVVGGANKGFKDGNFKELQFNGPQGLAFLGEILYVADTENHAIRKIDLETKMVTTLVGTGNQGQDKAGGKKGTLQEISSPWDVAVGRSVGSETDDVLFIAMAGTHQIWVYFLQDGNWYKGRRYQAGTCVRFAGSGNEENRNNSYPEKASFAQPSGLALSSHSDMNALFVADSESSTVRSVFLKDGSVKALVGGERDPQNLFAYGDEDGIGLQAKLQHPLGVALVTDDKGPLLVADSYNHKIKIIDLKTKRCETWAAPSSDKEREGDHLKITLNEPGGLCVDQTNQIAYIADTNDHVIRTVDLSSKSVSQLPILFQSIDANDVSKKKQVTDFMKPTTKTLELESLALAPGSTVDVILRVMLPDGHHFTDEAPSSWMLICKDLQDKILEFEYNTKGNIESLEEQRLLALKLPVDIVSPLCLYIKCRVFFCDDSGVCRLSERVHKQNITFKSDISETSAYVNISFKL